MELTAGSVLLGKYRVDELLGAGGMGRVVRASHLYLQQPVAIKILLPEMADSAETVSRFLREAQSTVRLRSEHIARVMDVGTMPDGAPFMVMEYLEGNDLNQILRHHGPQTPSIVCDLMLQACEGMAEAHALGIVHRDIKPSNYFITRRPDGSMLLKILDFGISKTPVGVTELTGTQTVIGTPTYMAPEQMKSGRSADARSDIWSMGVVMFQLLSGRPPFSGESYAELVIKVGSEPPAPIHVPLPAGLGEVIMRCLEKNPLMRQQNVGELARMLAPYASDPISAAQSAARTTRILQQRNSLGVQGLPLAAGGGLATPPPLSPAQLTPRSWPPSPSSTSVSRGAGQLTYRVRGGRGLVIAAVAGMCLGVGGYATHSLLDDEAASDEPHVQAPPPLPGPAAAAAPTPAAASPAAAARPAPTPPAPAPAAAAAPPPATTARTEPRPTATPSSAKAEPKPTATPSSAKTEPKPTAAKAEPKPTAAKAEPKPTAAKAEPKPVTSKPTTPTTVTAEPKPTSRPTRPTTKPTRPKPGKGDKTNDLFDTRH